MQQSALKGLVHLGLTLTAVAELTTATSRTRKILLGSMAGFHTHAVLYHFFLEDDKRLANLNRRGNANDTRKRHEGY